MKKKKPKGFFFFKFMTYNIMKKKALEVIANQIKVLDQNSFLLAEVVPNYEMHNIRASLFRIISRHGYALELNSYKLVKKEK